MRTGIMLFTTTMILALTLLGGCATGKYVPKADEELYGTWINESITPQKEIDTPDGWKQYLHISDSASFYEGTEVIISKWTDSEGNVWYKVFGTYTAGVGDYNGKNFTMLEKFSKSSTVRESMWAMAMSDQEIKTPTYPTKIDPKDSEYSIYYRAKK